ncbi:MAG TPA: hypothetical protein VFK32_09670 [Tepidiformaceae bacterium]|nr:hypothetical protein [Tepidiformaceae bacterium]
MLLAARLTAGPLAFAGFFLPWAAGPGPFAANDFSGYSLVAFSGRLRALDLDPGSAIMLWAIHLAILGVAVAAAWLTMLAPLHRKHPVYRMSGWYVSAVLAVALAIGLVRGGVVLPPLGLALWIGGAACFIAAEAAPAWARRVRRYRISRAVLEGVELRADLGQESG